MNKLFSKRNAIALMEDEVGRDSVAFLHQKESTGLKDKAYESSF